MASSSLVVQFCCICQEEYNSPSELDLLRPDSCPSHWFHRGCLNDWLKHQKRCPTCLADCSSAVDKNGVKIFDGEAGESLDTEQEEEEIIDLEELFSLMFRRFLSFDWAAPSCSLCCLPLEIDVPTVLIEPCKHRFHSHCVLLHISLTGNDQCPHRYCRRMIAVIFEIELDGPPSIVYYNSSRINHPRYAVLREHLGLTAAPTVKPSPCALCGKVRPALARVLPTNCPGKHIVHEECMDQFAGTDSIRRCPVDGCGRQFLSVTHLPPPDSRSVGNQASNDPTPDSIGKCVVCDQDLAQVDAVRPNNCEHLYHRDCLSLVTNHNRKCPARRCGKKFRSVVRITQ